MLHFSKQEDYAIILLTKLAENYNKKIIPLSQIAKEYNLPVLFLRNLANGLRSSGFIKAIEGKKGGYLLSKDPKSIRLGEILRVFSKKPMLECCPIGKQEKIKCEKTSFCSSGFLLRKLNKEFLDKIHSLNLSDFVKNKQSNI